MSIIEKESNLLLKKFGKKVKVNNFNYLLLFLIFLKVSVDFPLSAGKELKMVPRKKRLGYLVKKKKQFVLDLLKGFIFYL